MGGKKGTMAGPEDNGPADNGHADDVWLQLLKSLRFEVENSHKQHLAQIDFMISQLQARLSRHTAVRKSATRRPTIKSKNHGS